MPPKLTDYERKRDFEATPEPSAGGAPPESGLPRFVVQEHSATRLHWDLRLEHDGVAVSWAIPNGIPADPAENRKAVHTEDHPLEYLEFEGDIPKGQYGAGTMRIWDRGTYEPHSWGERKVVVDFHGERVRGRYALFQTGEDKDWMIHRIDPPDEPRAPLPENLVPMLARLAPLPRDDGGWGIEVKWDGVRAIAYCRPGRIRLESRNLNDLTAGYPEVRGLVRALGAHDAVLDGELVAFDADGRPSFERLQQRMHQTSESVVRRRMKSHPVTYVIFDLLHLDGRDLMAEPYARRRERLLELGLSGEHWQTPEHATSGAARLLAASAEQGLEGLVLKRLDSRYEPGRRGGSWLKVKNTARQELVIGGWLPGEGRRANTIGALLVGYYEGDELRYAGKVGTGFSERQLASLLARLRPLERPTSPFSGRQPERASLFVEPELVAEIEFREWTAERLLRHPSFKGLRDDKPPRDVRLETPVEPPAGDGEPAPVALLSERARARSGATAEIEIEGRRLRLSNLDELLYPQAGFTKGQLIDHYARIADVLLPHLHARPLRLRRRAQRPKWVKTTPIRSGRDGAEVDHCLVDDLPTLVWVANLADVELHASLSTAADMSRPTAVAFDLDPEEPAGVLDCCEIALLLRGMLAQLGLDSYPKTSGSNGLQLYVPLNGEATYEQTKPFAEAVAETFERQLPGRVVAGTTKSPRSGKVLIDWTRNDEHETTLCVYSLRAGERPTASTPVAWDEVEAARDAGDAGLLTFSHRDVLARIERHGDLFAPVLSRQQALPAA